jgi:uncharacterized protein YaaW (UPF0174 family)
VIVDLEAEMARWNQQEIEAFFCCVRSHPRTEIPQTREGLTTAAINELFWAFNSKTVAEGKRKGAQALSFAYEALPQKVKNRTNKPAPVGAAHDYGKTLTYEYLLREACKKSSIQDSHCEPMQMLEIYLFETVITRMLVAMTARQRHEALTTRVQLKDMAAGFPAASWAGPMTTLAALSAAQASGFGVYMGATTALGFASHAVGVTLPFAAYAGMTSTIAFLIGPAGVLATGGWIAHVLTSPEWARIIRGLLHIIAMRAKYEYSGQPLLTS